jgi:hypothetical protein
MMRLTWKLGLVAIVVGVAAVQAQAAHVIRFPHKGAPYAVPHGKSVSTQTKPQAAKKRSGSPQRVSERGAAVILAHHKPPYHGDVSPPKNPRPTQGGKLILDDLA